jgi:hypothetical protein
MQKTPDPVNLRRVAGAGKGARASFTLQGLWAESSAASRGKSDWATAKAIVGLWERADSWDGKVESDAPPVVPSLPGRIAITDATKVFLSNREGAKIAPATLRKYRTFIKQLTNFTETRGYVMLDQVTSSDIDVFYGGWELGARTKGKMLGTLRAFFRFCANRKWLHENPVSSDIRPPVWANRVANKAPFSDDELRGIIDACDRLGEVAWSNGREKGIYTGEDVKDFILAHGVYGPADFRCGFVSHEPTQRQRGFPTGEKNGGEVFAYIPDWLQDRLTTRARRYGVRPFVVGHSDRIETLSGQS